MQDFRRPPLNPKPLGSVLFWRLVEVVVDRGLLQSRHVRVALDFNLLGKQKDMLGDLGCKAFGG